MPLRIRYHMHKLCIYSITLELIIYVRYVRNFLFPASHLLFIEPEGTLGCTDSAPDGAPEATEGGNDLTDCDRYYVKWVIVTNTKSSFIF